MDACVRKVFNPVILFDAEWSTSEPFIHDVYKRVEERMDYNSRNWSKYCKPDAPDELAASSSSSTASALSALLPPILAPVCNSPGPSAQQVLPDYKGPTMMSVRPRRPRNNLPKHTTDFLKDWLEQHKRHPYPTDEEKYLLASMTGLQLPQISNWFINARRRHLPRDASSIRRTRVHHHKGKWE